VRVGKIEKFTSDDGGLVRPVPGWGVWKNPYFTKFLGAGGGRD